MVGDAVRCRRTQRLTPERKVDRPSFRGQGLHHDIELDAIHDTFNAGEALRLITGRQQRPFRSIGCRRARREEQCRGLAAAVDQQNRARHFHAGQIEELLALLELGVRGRLGGAGQDGHAVTDGLHDFRTAGLELPGVNVRVKSGFCFRPE